MVRKVQEYIEINHLPTTPAKLIVGLSGGADSTVLLYILHRLGYKCLAAHCNFHLRGEESMRDEQQALAFAASLQVLCFKKDFNTRIAAKQQNVSIEMIARDLRYEWFEYLRCEYGATAIAVAHHCDDNIETMLMNLIRGTGIRGLTGIKPQNGTIIRPLLCISKREILEFAVKQKLPYVIDTSNLQDKFMRNKIRLSVLPLLQTLNPSIKTTLQDTMHYLHETTQIYDYYVRETIRQLFNHSDGSMDIKRLSTFPSPEVILFEWLKEYGFSSDTVRNITFAMDKQSGKIFHSRNYTLIKDRNRFILIKRKEKKITFQLEIPKEYLTIQTIDKNFQIIKDKDIAYFDFDRLRFPLKIRNWKTGDHFMPFGMNHFQKLSDFFTTNKFSLIDKRNIHLLCSGNDIIWIIGHRIDHRYRIMNSTRKVVILKVDDLIELISSKN